MNVKLTDYNLTGSKLTDLLISEKSYRQTNLPTAYYKSISDRLIDIARQNKLTDSIIRG